MTEQHGGGQVVHLARHAEADQVALKTQTEKAVNELESRIAELAEKEQLAALRPELDGVTVMQLLDMKPGRDVGRALDFLMEIRLEEGLLGEEEITRRLRDWWSVQTH